MFTANAPTGARAGGSLRTLLSGLIPAEVLSALPDREISGVCDDSRRAVPGALFVALRGVAADGRAYVADAVARGAAVVLGEGLPADCAPLVVNTADARTTLAHLAVRWHGVSFGAGGLTMLGVTGTNGKTTTAIMTRAILQAAGRKCGLLGTVYYDLCGRTITADMTTPGALVLAGYLRECLDAGASAAVMEVSSHALEQRRADGVTFAAAAFTNLTGDHLDYHHTMENYAAAKARLFANLAPDAVAVMNRDDPAHARMLEGCRARVLTYGLGGQGELTAGVVRDTAAGTIFRMRIGAQELVLENAIVGRHNVYNALAAAGLAYAIGIGVEAIQTGLASVRNVPGRLQRVPCVSGADVFVDYAHTDDALRNVLRVLKPLTRNRLMVVFGCGGDRDRTKRPRMAAAAAEFADAIIVTSDNPRSESPTAIIDEILTGFDAECRRRVVVEPDRRAAIRIALAGADEGDIVLIAGKGHESYQIVGAQRLHFDDVEVAIQAAAELGGRRDALAGV